MTMPDERTRALIWAGSFLVELARDSSLSPAIRRKAVVIARHFPTLEDVKGLAAQLEFPSGFGPSLAFPHNAEDWLKSSPCGPLLHSTPLHSTPLARRYLAELRLLTSSTRLALAARTRRVTVRDGVDSRRIDTSALISSRRNSDQAELAPASNFNTSWNRVNQDDLHLTATPSA